MSWVTAWVARVRKTDAVMRLVAWNAAPAPFVDVLAPLVCGLVARASMVLWASDRFPPTQDGRYYQIFAERLASGLGYTWLWPDGVVTPAAHYPVGYPALVSLIYRVTGPSPAAAMLFNALLGCVAIVAIHRVVAGTGSRGGALFAAFWVALQPGLVAYTPALMTEGVTASLLAIAAWITWLARSRKGVSAWLLVAALGLLFGVATLIRPQNVLLAPVFGGLAAPEWRALRPSAGWVRAALGRGISAALVGALAVLVCLPWTLRNCDQMKQCVFVSANGGWNLLIGAGPRATGAWVPIDDVGMPEECRTVYDEAGKDRCFGRGAVRLIEQEPLRWLSLVPKKLGATFDFADAAGWYLNSSNGAALDDAGKRWLAGLEIGSYRALLLAALIGAAKIPGPRRRPRLFVVGAALLLLGWSSAWPAVVGLVVALGLLGRNLVQHLPAGLAMAVLVATALTHAVFFGAGRYALVCFTLLAALAGSVFPPSRPRGARA
jgi:4-amino-4-deoxy-L-arabinose transferase-like glycosyltransferase